ADRLLQRRILIELVEDQMRIRVAFDIDDQPDRLATASAALIAHGADALDALVLDEIADGLMEAVARLLERHLRNNDLGPVGLFANVGPRPQGDLAPAGAIAVEDALPAADDATGGKIGARNDLHQLLNRYLGVINDFDEAVADFAQVVRRNLGGH